MAGTSPATTRREPGAIARRSVVNLIPDPTPPEWFPELRHLEGFPRRSQAWSFIVGSSDHIVDWQLSDFPRVIAHIRARSLLRSFVVDME